MIVYRSETGDHYSPKVDILKLDIGVLSAFSICLLTFSCHQCAIDLYQQLENRSPKRFAIVCLICFMLSFGLCFAVSLEGSRQFGKNVDGNVLKSYEIPGKPKDWIMVAVKLTMGTVVAIGGFPIT
eukprot:UN00660